MVEMHTLTLRGTAARPHDVTEMTCTLFLTHTTASCEIRGGLNRGPKQNAWERDGSHEVQTIYSMRKAEVPSERGLKLLRGARGGAGGQQMKSQPSQGKRGRGGLSGLMAGDGEGKGSAIFTVSHLKRK